MEQRSSPAWVDLPQGCSPLPSSTGVRAGQTLQPDTWVTESYHQNSACEAASVVVGVELREAMAFY